MDAFSYEDRQDQTIIFSVDGLPTYNCQLTLGGGAGGAAKMTTLLYVMDFIKERTGISKMPDSETKLFFDSENITTPEEILLTKMDQALIKKTVPANPFTD